MGQRRTSTANLFAYGTLMCPDIMAVVAGRAFRHSPAVLRSYRRQKMISAEYPAIVPADGETVCGIVYFDVSQGAWERLHRFEGTMYAAVCVQAACDDGRDVVAATYVLRPEFTDQLSGQEWSFEEFLLSGKDAFINSYTGFDRLVRDPSLRPPAPAE